MAYRDHLCLRDGRWLTQAYAWYDPAAQLDKHVFWKITCASTLKLVIFGFGLFPKIWALCGTLSASLPNRWSLVVCHGALNASAVLPEAITGGSSWEIYKLLPSYPCGLCIMALCGRFSRLRKSQQFLFGTLCVAGVLCGSIAVPQLGLRRWGPSLPAGIATEAAALCARVVFDARNVCYLGWVGSRALVSAPFPVIVVGNARDRLAPEELLGALAHELGHWSLWHGHGAVLFIFASMLLYCCVAIYCYDRPSFYRSLGFQIEDGQRLPLAAGILALGCLIQTLAFFVNSASCSILQIQVYQADAFAASLGFG